MREKKPKPLFISTPRGDKSPFDDFLMYYKYSFKCKKCGLVLYAPKLSGDYIDECYSCNCKEFKRRYLADFLRLLKYLFTNVFKWAKDKIEKFWPVVLIIAICIGFGYSIYWFNKNECDRVHNLGYETDFDFFGGCYVKVNGHWIPFKIQGVNVITEGK